MFYHIAKRTIDIVLAVFFIIIFSPIMFLCALLIKLENPSCGIFSDAPMRLCKGKKVFTMYKFRSMIPNANKVMRKGKKYSDLKRKWLDNQGKLKNNEDPRITKVGKVLRKFDLDELPQFFNVLKGDMSIVGPRAYFQSEYTKFRKQYPSEIKNLEYIFIVKPGITGLWQVSGRNSLTIPERINLDFEYASNKSIINDIKIMLKTPFVIISRKGAVD